MIKGSHILIFVLGVVILLMHYCTPHTSQEQEKGYIVEHVTVIDSLYVPGVADTTHFIDTIPYFVEVPVPIPYYDTLQNLNIYDSPYEDSLLSGFIHSEVDGTLVFMNFTYTPKFPQYINKTDTLKVFRTDSITMAIPEEPKVKLYVGLHTGGNRTSFSLGPSITVATKKNVAYNYRYDFINKTHEGAVEIKLGR